MARAGSWISSRCSINAISQAQPIKPFYFSPNNTKASLKGNDFSLITKRSQRASKRLVTISTSDGRWHGEWKCDYIFSLRDLQLEDLAEDGHKDTQVSINLCIHKHTGFGLSVDGRVITSFTRKCSNCSSTYCREVIYVKPGFEADLDSLIQDTISLAAAVKETCSESCEKSQPKLQPLGKENAASIDRRWSRLLELKKVTLMKSQ
ncbi:large ribosomal RNA subunit accumulation protein YCED homolog 2, chloroplastic isoform X3 [Nicotiana tabacum]|uniref:Large ribosomal RNA subunit accumulation protein YCED homolog 2, chloroplastic isoform X3 n=1 Tax=Nicotiana tabacum TaxID=4097 RepID=A0AC58SCL1_TOBAC